MLAQRLRLQGGVGQDRRGLQGDLGVMGEDHVDTLRHRHLVSSAHEHRTPMTPARARATPGARRRGWGSRWRARSPSGCRARWPAPLLDAGWTPGAVVLVRLAVAAPGGRPARRCVALRGRWSLLRRNARLVAALRRARRWWAPSSATSPRCAHMPVGARPAHRVHRAGGRRRRGCGCATASAPAALTVVGAGVAVVGLVLVLDLLSGADLSLAGVLWSLAAMVGAASYFVISADESTGLPPLALAGRRAARRRARSRSARRWSGCCR